MDAAAALALLFTAPLILSGPVEKPEVRSGAPTSPLPLVMLSTGEQGHRMLLDTEVRAVNPEEGTLEYVASNQALDSYREIVAARGWILSRVGRSCPLVDSHNYYGGIVGGLGKVAAARIEGDQLICTAKFAIEIEENALARFGFKMAAAGYLPACSVGFIPNKFAARGYSSDEEWANAVLSLSLAPEIAAVVRCIYLQQTLIELSPCLIGANPEALLKGIRDGAVSGREVELAAAQLRSLVGAAGPTNLFRGQSTASEPGPAPVNPAGGASDLARRADAEWLRKLSQIVS